MGEPIRSYIPDEPTKPTNKAQPLSPVPLSDVGAPDSLPDNPVGLLRVLEARGIDLVLKDDQILCRFPAGAMTPELRQKLEAMKPRLVKLLAQEMEPVCDVVQRFTPFRPRTLTLVRHNLTGVNRFGQDAETRPFAMINLPRWREWPWSLRDCHWYMSKEDAELG